MSEYRMNQTEGGRRTNRVRELVNEEWIKKCGRGRLWVTNEWMNQRELEEASETVNEWIAIESEIKGEETNE
jgi:hypothetical protein